MHEVSQSLADMPEQSGFRPVVVLKASRRCPAWEEIYTGNEPDYYHAMVLTSSATLVRARITPPEDGRKLYVQSIPQAGSGSDFTGWYYVNCYNVVVLAVTACGEEVQLFYILADRRIERLISQDAGLTWNGPEIVDYCPTTAINGIAAGCNGSGTVALFFADQDTLYLKNCENGVWQARASWPYAAGMLSGVAVVYDGDWTLMVTGRDLSGACRLWRLVYGDGCRYSTGQWSGLTELAGAPAGENYAFEHASLSFTAGVYRCLYNELYSGSGAYCHSRLLVSVSRNLWAEPVAFAGDGLYGFAQAAGNGWLWAGSSWRLYRARLDEPLLDLSPDVVGLKLQTGCRLSRLRVELDNSGYGYSAAIPALEPGGLVRLGLGYVTPEGAETGPMLEFDLTGRELLAGRGSCRLVIEAGGGWERLSAWQARHQYRWNRTPGETAVVKIIAFLLARAGMMLQSGNASAVANTLTPDFTLNPGARGDASVIRLLGMLPDRLILEGLNGYLYNPEEAGEPFYNYSGSSGSGCPVYESGRKKIAPEYNHIQIEGEEPLTGELILGTALDRNSILNSGERLLVKPGEPINNTEEAIGRARELLDELLSRSSGGYIRAPVNPAGQVGDVVGIDCPENGFSGSPFRIVATETVYEPRRGRYEQVIELEAVPDQE